MASPPRTAGSASNVRLAAEALSHAAATGEITPDQAQDELFETIIAMVDRSARSGTQSVDEGDELNA